MLRAVAGLVALGLVGEAAAQETAPSMVTLASVVASQTAEPAGQGGGDNGRRRGTDFVWRDHPSLRFGRNLRIDFQAKFQWDAMNAGDDPTDFDPFRIRRARVGIDAEVFRHVQISVEREINETEIDDDSTERREPLWKDVYVELNYTDAAQVRLGKFKVPFGLDQLTGVANNDFSFRSLGASYLAPARDIGGMVHGRFFDRGLNYWVGVFEHDGDNARSSKMQGGDETLAVRVTGTPFRVWPRALGSAEIGGAFTVSRLSDESTLPNGLRGRTVISKYVFFEPVFVKGTRRRMELDVDWPVGPVGIRAEYTQVRDDRENQGLADQDLSDARARAWYVAGTWLLTGEKKERPVEPRNGGVPLGGAGAVELVGRIERLWFDSVNAEGAAFRNPRARNILPSGEHVLTLGVNWYVNRWTKLQLQSMREQPQDAERSPVLDGAAFWSAVFRVQLTM
jgi:phosphate-selective porin OprO/OprP